MLSSLTSRKKVGITALEYGINPATSSMVERGSSVGIVAAQSIGEPGTVNYAYFPHWWYCIWCLEKS